MPLLRLRCCVFIQTFRNGSDFELCALSVPGLLDALEPSAVQDWLAILDTELINCFEFATTRSSSPGFSSCICLSDMVFGLKIEPKWLQENIEKLMRLNERRIWFQSTRVKLLFVNMSASSFFSCQRFWFEFWVQIDSVKQPIKCNSVGSGTRVSQSGFCF